VKGHERFIMITITIITINITIITINITIITYLVSQKAFSRQAKRLSVAALCAASLKASSSAVAPAKQGWKWKWKINNDNL
jgi:hypothetical protein